MAKPNRWLDTIVRHQGNPGSTTHPEQFQLARFGPPELIKAALVGITDLQVNWLFAPEEGPQDTPVDFGLHQEKEGAHWLKVF